MCKMLWKTCTHTDTHTHAHRKNTAIFFLSAAGLWESQRIVYDIHEKGLKEGATHAFLRRSQKKPLNGQKEKLQKKLSPPSPCEKGPCARLLPNVGVPKILPDRKFPILRCVLKSRSHPNAVTVILLTLIAFLHPSSLSFTLSLCPSLTLYFICGTERGFAGLLLIACERAPGTVCTGR